VVISNDSLAPSLLQSAVVPLHAAHTHFPTDFRISERVSYLEIHIENPSESLADIQLRGANLAPDSIGAGSNLF